MKSKTQKAPATNHRRSFVLSLLVVIVLVCIANLYSAYLNLRFINSPLALVYYFNLIILLGGGFAAGYFLTPRTAKPRVDTRLFAGATYGLLAFMLYLFSDVLRSIARLLHLEPTYPWAWWVFIGTPLVAVAVTALIALTTQYRRRSSEVTRAVKLSLVGLFVGHAVFMLATNLYDVATRAATYAPDVSLWSIIGSYLFMPLTIGLVVYLFLGTIKPRLDRAFYATLIALVFNIIMVIWPEFRTEPTPEATNTAWYIALAVSLVITGLLTWRARRLGR